jgi:hypothetical protein
MNDAELRAWIKAFTKTPHGASSEGSAALLDHGAHPTRQVAVCALTQEGDIAIQGEARIDF